jgi:hypothetical protein
VIGRRARGAALLESAIVVSVLLLLAFGAAEIGLLWRDTNRIEHSVQAAGRVGSNAANSRLADLNLLESLEGSLQGLTGGEVERVVVFKASAADGEVPDSCIAVNVVSAPLSSHGVPNTCNVYSSQQLEGASQDDFGAGGDACVVGDWDENFCPTTRQRGSSNATYLGVFVRTIYEPITSVLAGDVTIDRTTVYRLEPCVPALEGACT